MSIKRLLDIFEIMKVDITQPNKIATEETLERRIKAIDLDYYEQNIDEARESLRE